MASVSAKEISHLKYKYTETVGEILQSHSADKLPSFPPERSCSLFPGQNRLDFSFRLRLAKKVKVSCSFW